MSGRRSLGDKMLATDWLEASAVADLSKEDWGEAVSNLKLARQLRVFGGE